MKKIVSKAKRRTSPKGEPAQRGKDAVIKRYGGTSFDPADKERRELIDWLEGNLLSAVAVFGGDLVQRKLCELKGSNFEFDYEDPND
jgi:hypothetical protein